MERRFAADFSQVRIHVGGRSAESARAVNALAYTVGQHVVFGTGEYSPQTSAGQRLLAHELTHVVQQRGLGAASAMGEIEIGAEQSAHEREAQAVAARGVNGDRSAVPRQTLVRPGLQRAVSALLSEGGGEPVAQAGTGPLPAAAIPQAIPACANPQIFTELVMPVFIPNSYLEGSDPVEKSAWKADLAAAQKNHCDAKGEFDGIELNWDFGNPALGSYYTKDLNKGSIKFDLRPHLIFTGKPCCACLTGQVTWSFDIAISRTKGGKTVSGKTKAPIKGTKKGTECDGVKCCSVNQNLDVSLSMGDSEVTFDITGKAGIVGDVRKG